ncbi:MAG: alpha/beta fold hydrolase [Sphingobacteriales bacterium]|nr:MAG: alpha/beta fold hydrolase [Sphingobacteriales bacterium]
MDQKTGCLVIHGFGGSIREVEPLVSALESQGYMTSCPALKGHTANRKDLGATNWKDWVASAEEELLCLIRDCSKVFICGFSMGGLIGMHLAVKYPLEGLITINSPIYYLDFKKIASNILFDLRTKDYSNIRRYLKPSNRVPFKSMLNFRDLVRTTIKLIPSLESRLLIVQAIDDDVVHHKSAGYIYTHAVKADREVATYVRGGHVILLSDTAFSVISDIMSFLNRPAAPAR